MPITSQVRNATVYVIITSLVLVFLNVTSANNIRSMMFGSKYDAAQDKMQLMASTFSTVDDMNTETVSQVMSVLGNQDVTRIVIVDAQGLVIYDSLTAQNSVGKFALFKEIEQALGGNDVFYSTYNDGVLESRSAMPLVVFDRTVGAVYMLDRDTEQGGIIADLESNIFRSSVFMVVLIIILSFVFSALGSRRMKKIVLSVRMAREGEYNQKIRMSGMDELAKLASEFNKLTERLQLSETAQKQFISDASHELKTPLASIKLLSDSILQNEMDADTMREFVTDIGRESDRLTRLAQKMLSLSQSENEKELEHELVDLEHVVSRAFRMLIPLAEQKNVKLTGNLEHDCTVLSAEDDVYQIIFNLVENGIKYNKDGGEVNVSVWRDAEDVVILVKDTGVGMPQESLDHIFERFYRVDKARSRQAGGSGLGLSIVNELVKRNLGRISVSSTECIGSCFTITFPYFEVSEEDAHA